MTSSLVERPSFSWWFLGFRRASIGPPSPFTSISRAHFAHSDLHHILADWRAPITLRRGIRASRADMAANGLTTDALCGQSRQSAGSALGYERKPWLGIDAPANTAVRARARPAARPRKGASGQKVIQRLGRGWSRAHHSPVQLFRTSCAAEQRDELASLHSITSSARAS